MNRVSRRASALLLLVILLSGGVGFFLYEYFTKAGEWVISTGSPHIYNSTNIGTGQILDREGVLLLDMTGERTYAEDSTVRKSTLHWLGDRFGQISAPAIANYAREISGFDLVDGLYSYGGAGGQAELTLSSYVQSVALEALGDRKGTIAVYNYKTGEILCAVTAPAYDPDNVPDVASDESGAYEGVYLNRFVQSSYVPGSIFKIVTTAAALDCVPDIETMTFRCTGTVDYGTYDVTCERVHGNQSLKAALANSCNCAYAQIVGLIGAERLEEYVEAFCVTKPVTFDGVTTAGGNFDLTGASSVQIAWSGIGQHTDLINPCRYLYFMGMIAGGGRAAQPYLVSRVLYDGNETYRAQTDLSDAVMSAEIAENLQGYLRNNVVNVYGADRFGGLTVCAKSGTSQLGGGQTSNAMFAGFATDEKYPLAFIAVVENGGYGANTCIPILGKVLGACKAVMDAE